MRHSATALVLLSLAGTAQAAPNNKRKDANNRLRGRRRQLQAYLQAQQTRQLQNQNEQQGRSQEEEGVTRWDNDRISESNPDGLPTDPETGKLACWPNCYADHYAGPVDGGGGGGGVGSVGGGVNPVEYNRNDAAGVQTEQAETIDRGVQIALDAVQKYRAANPVNPYHPPSNTNTYTESRETNNPNPNIVSSNPNPNVVYDTSTGHQYDLTTGQQIVVEEVEEVNTGQVDVKVYVIEEQLPPAASAVGAASSGPLDDPTPTAPTTTYASTITSAVTSTPTTASAPALCTLPRNSPCSTNVSCASGCCAVLAQSTKCVDPSIAVFAQFCPKANPCGGMAGTKVPKITGGNIKKQDITTTYVHSATPQTGGGGDTSTGGDDVLYTLGPGGTFITTSNGGNPNPSTSSNPNRIEGGTGQGEPEPVDCTIQKDDWPMGKVPQGDDCAASCQCKTGCCVKYWAQICVDPTANNGHWADKCI
mmetsp:Transcript_18254/g.43231  ORF Transcript_18254/g.43231 Transcript_18254/m.43231 type:complete len:477 (+) Transcript_18254:215-1645(+)